MRRALPAAIAALALLASACGSASPSTSPSAPAAPAASAPPTATSTSQSTVTETTPATITTSATTPPAGPPPCRAADLSLSYLGGQGAAGHGELGFALHNTSRQTCSTIGYPGIQFLDQSGGTLPTIPTRTTTDFFGSVPKSLLDVTPGGSVSFRLGVTHGAAGATGCTTAFGLQVIAPNDTATLRTSIPNGAYECQTATVSPVAQGSSAFPGP